jgi:hypothetical protein
VAGEPVEGVIVGRTLPQDTDWELVTSALQHYSKYCLGRAKRMRTRPRENKDVLNRADALAWWERRSDRAFKLATELARRSS